MPTSRQPSTRRLFSVYAVATLLPVVVLGVLLSTFIYRAADQSGLRQGASEALLVARSSIAPRLTGHDLRYRLTRAEKASLSNEVRLIERAQQVLRLRVRDLAGRVVYADDGSGLGTVDDEALLAARGQTVTHLTWLNTDHGDTGRQGPRVIEAYVPLTSAQDGSPIGVLEVYLPYAPIQANISASLRVLTTIMILGLFLLWLASLGVSLSVSAKLRRQARENAFLARHDPLTGLPNRAEFAEQVTEAVRTADADRQVALGLIDLDRFKDVNDTLGHGNGDELLVAVAHRLCLHLRDGDVVARLGGDEFGVLLDGVHGPSEAIEILIRLRTAINAPISIGALPLAVEASVGFALAPTDGTDPEVLLARADLAMYAAKASHSGILHYRPEHNHYDAAHLTLIGELATAIADDQLVLHYQPKASLRHGGVTAVEALVRWQHPEHGLLPPDRFLPGAEQTELIEPLTKWVLRTALRDLARLRAGDDLAVAVNISARSLIRTDFADDILTVIDDCGADPQRLILEITETALLVDPARAAGMLARLTRSGVRISVDDFGAGQTSLGYLARLPISELKIDKAFVLAMADPRNAAIVRSVIQLGHSLGISVTAEGVETRRVLDDLAAADCDLVQGYLLARPLPIEQLGPALDGVAATVRRFGPPADRLPSQRTGPQPVPADGGPA